MSDTFELGRGVKQGSVLSPTLFLIVMDPLLRVLESSGLGLSVKLMGSMVVVSCMRMT